MWVDKGGVLLRENKTKVVTTIGNYLNNLEGSRKADGELTNPCMCSMHHGVTIVIASQATRLGKGSSVTMQDKHIS